MSWEFTLLYKVKSHAGKAGNERANKFAKYHALLKDNLTNTGIPSADPGGSLLYTILIGWLGRRQDRL
eukprot:scaffold180540_cov21-Tisochrysis_lutea.AAC.1